MFTPSILATPPRKSISKRKRPSILISQPNFFESTSSQGVASKDSTIMGGGTETLQVTPNPKPRKQHRRNISLNNIAIAKVSASQQSPSSLSLGSRRKSPSPSKQTLQSSYANNANADYVPSFPSHNPSSHRHSVTPIPAYEYPRESFTPPREVVVTPIPPITQRASKSGARKSAAKDLKPVIKTEPPDVDFSLPLPPPSPTDDPLLLSGPPVRPCPRPRPPSSKKSIVNENILFRQGNRGSSESPSWTSTSHISDKGAIPFGRTAGFDDSMSLGSCIDAAPLPLFDLDGTQISNGDWSDSDSDCGSGDYTGRFLMLNVPTKMDPPTSETRDRMVRWGRPISPFPGSKGGLTTIESHDDQSDEEEASNERVRVDMVDEQGRGDDYGQAVSTADIDRTREPDEDDSDSEGLEANVVQISSHDPRAAARAAAILKLVRHFLPTCLSLLMS